MGHYTLMSGIKTTTLSSYCPICRKKKQYTSMVSDVDITQLCCSYVCEVTYRQKLIDLERTVTASVGLQCGERLYSASYGTISTLAEAVLSGDEEAIIKVKGMYMLHESTVTPHKRTQK